ncbi:hypothetical protein EON63_23095 [archaeon]|nr:MAG: hypothetical protein EON63_23095 [archaeon]
MCRTFASNFAAGRGGAIL